MQPPLAAGSSSSPHTTVTARPDTRKQRLLCCTFCLPASKQADSMTDSPPLEQKHTYPPPESSSFSSSSLYSQSPHAKADSKRRRAAKYADPTWTIFFILFLALIYWSWPGIEKPWTTSHSKQLIHTQPAYIHKMPWQTTFTLASRGKGCHLVTDEVQKHIAEGLKQTKVRPSPKCARENNKREKLAHPLTLCSPSLQCTRLAFSPSSFNTHPPVSPSTRTSTRL